MQTLFYIRFSPIVERVNDVDASLAQSQQRFFEPAENPPEGQTPDQERVQGFLFSLGSFESIDEVIAQGFYQRCLNRLSGYTLHLMGQQPGEVEAISYDVFDRPDLMDTLMSEWRLCFEKAGLSPSPIVDIPWEQAQSDHEALRAAQQALTQNSGA